MDPRLFSFKVREDDAVGCRVKQSIRSMTMSWSNEGEEEAHGVRAGPDLAFAVDQPYLKQHHRHRYRLCLYGEGKQQSWWLYTPDQTYAIAASSASQIDSQSHQKQETPCSSSETLK